MRNWSTALLLAGTLSLSASACSMEQMKAGFGGFGQPVASYAPRAESPDNPRHPGDIGDGDWRQIGSAAVGERASISGKTAVQDLWVRVTRSYVSANNRNCKAFEVLGTTAAALLEGNIGDERVVCQAADGEWYLVPDVVISG